MATDGGRRGGAGTVAPSPEQRGSAGDGGIERRQAINDLPEFLTPEEFGAYLRLGRSHVYDLLRRGEIPHVRFGRRIRIPKATLEQVVPTRPK